MQPHQDQFVRADCVNLTDLKEGDYIYMCSDGMLEQMEDREIVNILSLRKPDPEKIRILIGATKDNKDNHSAHLIRIRSVQDDNPVVSDMTDAKKQPSRHVLYIALAVVLFIILSIAFYVLMMRM